MIPLKQALLAFCRTLANPSEGCLHTHVHYRHHQKAFCQDCGYKVNFVWTLLHCRGCDYRRQATYGLGGAIVPKEKYCSHCGSASYRRVLKEDIQSEEIPYALCSKQADYSSNKVSNPFQETRSSFSPPPFYTWNKDEAGVVEGEVLKKEERRA